MWTSNKFIRLEMNPNEMIVKAVLKVGSTIRSELINEKVEMYLMSEGWTKNRYFEEDFHGTELEDDIEYLKIDTENVESKVDPVMKILQYKLRERDFEESLEELFSDEDSDEGEEKFIHATALPSAMFSNLWNSLVFEDGMKEGLLNRILVTTILQKKNVDPDLCGANNIILFHGPPGTGKTSLCKSLAQTATNHMIDMNIYKEGVLFEVNANSIFSKWFGETGKNVQMMFNQIKMEMADPRKMVFVILDECESLTSARREHVQNSDSIVAVNTLLTEIDRIKNEKNVLVLTTTNITGLVDMAFLSRVDIKMEVGLPTLLAINGIYISALTELQMKGVIKNINFEKNKNGKGNPSDLQILRKLSDLSLGFSGRTLRKIPLISLGYADISDVDQGLDGADFFVFMERAIRNEKLEVERISDSSNTP